MISRPIVAGPLTGCLLGEPQVGLQAGALVELLWLGRLPVGAAIPPDDTQVAAGAVAMAVTAGTATQLSGLPLVLLAVLIAVPLGKSGQFFERLARNRNRFLLQRAELAAASGCIEEIERSHRQGLLHAALASLATFTVILAVGSAVLRLLAPLLAVPVGESANWLLLGFIVVGTAVILGTINVSRAMTLFAASFATAFLMLWLL
jgi:PTS system mannose-specific IIC component